MDLEQRIETYLQDNWETVVADIDQLVRIASVEDLDGAFEGAPYGEGPRIALDCALDMAARMGFDAHDCAGRIGYADLAGQSDTQVAVIGHVDVVPAGPGWTFPAYQVTRKDGYLLGRGVADDKGPLVVALHAVKFWKDLLDDGLTVGDALPAAAGAQARLPYTVRVIFGANEETNMADVAYYREHFDDPAFLFTPDAEFPVSYGEAGICHGLLESAPLAEGRIVELQGGVAVNAVPGQAHAVVRTDGLDLPDAPGICVTGLGDGLARIDATGKSAHASTPELGVNAIGLLVDYLLLHRACTYEERLFLQLQHALLAVTGGSGLGVQAADEHFGALTAVGGTVQLEGGVIRQSIDFRYPTTITSAEIAQKVDDLAGLIGGSFRLTHDAEPFLVAPDSPAIQALLAAYNEATGENACAFTMKGGTYARMFPTAASFGPEKPWEEKPVWVGGMHGPDEGISEDLLKQAFKVYALTIGKLMELDL